MLLDTCPAATTLKTIGRKWTYSIIRHLRQPATFTKLRRCLPGITNHVLAGELRRLMAAGILLHNGSHYALTKEGEALLHAAEELLRWAERHQGVPPCPPHQRCADCARHPHPSRSG